MGGSDQYSIVDSFCSRGKIRSLDIPHESKLRPRLAALGQSDRKWCHIARASYGHVVKLNFHLPGIRKGVLERNKIPYGYRDSCSGIYDPKPILRECRNKIRWCRKLDMQGATAINPCNSSVWKSDDIRKTTKRAYHVEHTLTPTSVSRCLHELDTELAVIWIFVLFEMTFSRYGNSITSRSSARQHLAICLGLSMSEYPSIPRTKQTECIECRHHEGQYPPGPTCRTTAR